MNLKRVSRILMVSTFSALLTAAFSGNAIADDKVYEFKMANVAAPDDVQYISFDYFAEILNERSEGRIHAVHYGNGAVGGSNQEQTEMVMDGSLQYTTTPGFVLYALNPSLASFNISDYPFLFDNTDEINAFLDGDIVAGMCDDATNAIGAYVRPGFNMGWYIISANSGPIRTPEDLAGLKIRSSTSEIYIKTLQAWDCNTTTIAYGELYTALQQGAADGMSTLAPLYIYQKFYEVQKYMGVVNYVGLPHWPVINRDFYDSLPDDLKAIFDECFEDYLAYTRQLHREVETSALDELRDLGMEVTVLTDEERQLWAEPAKSVWEEMSDYAGEGFLDKVRESLGK